MDSTQRKIARYISRSDEQRSSLREILDHIQREIPETVIFGGMVRDFGLSNVKRFSSDIDLVTTASAQDIYRLIRPYQPVRNKFGGFRFVCASRLFDIWSLEDTWAIREGYVKGKSLESLLSTTFFNLDAAFFRISDCRVYAAENYERCLSRRILDINLQENPDPKQMAVRAVHMAIKKDLFIAPNLGEFILRELYRKSASLLVESYVKNLSEHFLEDPVECFQYSPQLSIWR